MATLEDWKVSADKLNKRVMEDPRISAVNKKRIAEHVVNLNGERKNPRSIIRHLYGLLKLMECVSYKRDINTFTDRDIKKAIHVVEEQTYPKKIMENGKLTTKQVPYSEEVKLHFYAVWVKYYKLALGKGYMKPDNVAFIKITGKANQKRDPDSILEREDIMKMLGKCYNIRDSAFLYCLWESATRINEILSCTKKDLQIVSAKKGEYEAILHIHVSKTKQRKVPLFESVPYLLSYLESKYLQDAPDEAPLWQRVHAGHGADKGLQEPEARKLLAEIGMRAGITSKRLNPHSFRFSRITYESEIGVPQAWIKEKTGLTQSSNRIDVYARLKGTAVQEGYRKLIHGETTPKEIVMPVAPLQRCPKCDNDIRLNALFCDKCGAVLSQDKKDVVDEVDKNLIDKALDEYLKDPANFKRALERVSHQALVEDRERKRK